MRTWCNPLPLPRRPGSRGAGTGAADPEAVLHEGLYYLFVTGGQAYVSKDLFTWEYRRVETPFEVVGPALALKDGFFYLAGNGCEGMLRARHPLGPWENLGEIQDHEGRRVHWADLMFFVDEDGTFYCYHQPGTGVGTDGIFAAAMDPRAGYRRALSPARKCLGFEPAHEWERFGDRNEFPDYGWIEGPFMTRRGGKYHLQYSGCGTEWVRYAVGLYTADAALGPFRYDERSPLLTSTSGLLQGTGHHGLVGAADGRLWNVYHVLVHLTGKFDRRLALDPVDFDAEGRMVFHGPSQTPRNPDGSDAGLVPLGVGKEVRASSQAPGRDAAYAVDDNVRTFWQASDETIPQWLETDLGAEFTVGAQRLVFAEPAARGGSRAEWKPYGYRLEASLDGKAWGTVLDRTADGPDSDIRYDEVTGEGDRPVRARYLRLHITAKPSGLPVGVIDWGIFGKR